MWLCPSYHLACAFFFVLGHGVSLLMVVQQRVVILEFSQEKMSTHPSIPSFSSSVYLHTFVNDSLKNSSHLLFLESCPIYTDTGWLGNTLAWRITLACEHPLSTTQEKTLHTDMTRWSILKSDWSYCLQLKKEKLYTVGKNKTNSWVWLGSWTPYCQIQT